MNATPTCGSCGHGPIESSWKLCPVCGQSVNRDAITTLATKDTKPTEQDQIDRKRVYQQANQDLQNKARWILFLAVLGAFGVGWILLDRGNFEAGAIAIVISLAILLYLRTTGSRSQKRLASGCLTSISAFFIVAFFFMLWMIASIIFMLETCLRILGP